MVSAKHEEIVWSFQNSDRKHVRGYYNACFDSFPFTYWFHWSINEVRKWCHRRTVNVFHWCLESIEILTLEFLRTRPHHLIHYYKRAISISWNVRQHRFWSIKVADGESTQAPDTYEAQKKAIKLLVSRKHLALLQKKCNVCRNNTFCFFSRICGVTSKVH